MSSIEHRIAQELNVGAAQVTAAVALLDEGATVPFISRYRKEVTGGLDDTQLRTLEDRLRYLRELEDRRATILASIDEQGKLTDELAKAIGTADTKTELEDLYLPYKPKRRTKGQIAIEAGLEPLADALLADPTLNPEQQAEQYLNPDQNIADTKAALDGARAILMERFAEDAGLIGKLREYLWQHGEMQARLVDGKEEEGAKFRDYFEHNEPIRKVPSHRALAMFRGRNEGVLQLSLVLPGEEPRGGSQGEVLVAEHFGLEDQNRAADRWLSEVVRWTWRVKLLTHIETDLFNRVREAAEQAAIDVFAKNLKDLLLAAPAGPKATIGLDPGLRTGVKVAVVDETGKVVDHGAIFPTPPQNKIKEAEQVLVALCAKHNVELIAIGNGTASRETERFVKDVLKAHPEIKAQSVMVNESGASVYSASEFAAREFPDLDVTIRGAISIARRLQDPLAELVKIDPKSIGVGQYQHDVSQVALARQLDAVVEDCVNSVGVDLNTASAPLLTRVSGLNQTIAGNIVSFRDANGAFRNRKQLKDVSRLGPKAFEQAAGFLKVVGGENPLDASAVHPESYSVVERIVATSGRAVNDLVGDSRYLRGLKPEDYTDDQFGLPTVTDILRELEKPGRDPRPEFKTAEFQEGVEKLTDLRPNMILEGVATNVTHFGAFVDVGVHQDGLVHISAMSHQYIDDPSKVIKAGDIVKVKVMDVDVPRKRISLSMRLDDEAGADSKAGGKVEGKTGAGRGGNGRSRGSRPSKAEEPTAMAALMKEAMKKKGGRL
ncbi:Tex family protein [Saccharospirillum salsuginis]|uniref:RNA-binding transcriptional accessory protein n=1 Tax=Saccharospirillum salsuginis TaxID=418750 RepID=A0A918K655_9GAMM|nr:Tex family protein [Saccharospirillum salsuginis]GGX47436.1 RNA-binding transcriptional accessory protein [Saccharospirillum salsuginis]